MPSATVSVVSDTVAPASLSVTVTATEPMVTASNSLALLDVDGVGDGGCVVHGVAVLGGPHRHRLRRVPVGRGEGELRRRRRHVRIVAAHRDHHVGGGLHVQDHGVGCAAALGNRQRGLGHRRPGGLVIGDGHGHPGDAHVVELVGAAGGHHRVGDGRRVVHRVGVLGGCHRHRLRRVPVGRREGQGGRRHRHVRVTAAHRDNHVGGGLRVQPHRVGCRCRPRHRQRGFGHRHPGGLVIGDGHGHPGDAHVVVLVGAAGGVDGVGDGGRVVHRVGVLGGPHRHRLRRAPVARGEGQGGRRHRYVGTAALVTPITTSEVGRASSFTV